MKNDFCMFYFLKIKQGKELTFSFFFLSLLYKQEDAKHGYVSGCA